MGTRRFVLLSGRGEAEAQLTEEALKASGAEWTIVHGSWFMQNFSEGDLLDPVLSGEIALPVGGTPEPFVDAEDIADVALAALSDDRHLGPYYELTEPRGLTFAQATKENAQACGRPVSLVRAPIDAYAAAAAEHGVRAAVLAVLRYLFTEVLDGRNAHLSDGVQRALGREPRDFRDFVRLPAASGVWTRE